MSGKKLVCESLEAWLLGTEEHERCQKLRGQRIKQDSTALNIQAERQLKVQRNHEAENIIGVKKVAQRYVQSHPQT